MVRRIAMKFDMMTLLTLFLILLNLATDKKFDFWATVGKTVRPMLSDRCLSVCLSVLSVCLSVTLVYCGQTVGRIKMKLGMQVGLGHIFLDGDPAPPPQNGAEPSFPAHVCCGQIAACIKMLLSTR